jgi:hypothetical protein
VACFRTYAFSLPRTRLLGLRNGTFGDGIDSCLFRRRTTGSCGSRDSTCGARPLCQPTSRLPSEPSSPQTDAGYSLKGGGIRKGQRDLEKAAGLNEIVGEVWTEGITAPRGTGAPLADQSVIHERHDLGRWRKRVQCCASADPPELFPIEAFALEQTVGRRPVTELQASGTEEPGKGAAAQAS